MTDRTCVRQSIVRRRFFHHARLCLIEAGRKQYLASITKRRQVTHISISLRAHGRASRAEVTVYTYWRGVWRIETELATHACVL